jgi:hypothetical protein
MLRPYNTHLFIHCREKMLVFICFLDAKNQRLGFGRFTLNKPNSS